MGFFYIRYFFSITVRVLRYGLHISDQKVLEYISKFFHGNNSHVY